MGCMPCDPPRPPGALRGTPSGGRAERPRVHQGWRAVGLRQRFGFALALLSDPRLGPRRTRRQPRCRLPRVVRRLLVRGYRRGADDPRLDSRRAGTDGGQPPPHRSRRRPCSVVRCRARRGNAQVRGAMPPRPGSIAPASGRNDRCHRQPLADRVRGAARRAGTGRHGHGLDSASGLALQAFGRTTATLMNLSACCCRRSSRC